MKKNSIIIVALFSLCGQIKAYDQSQYAQQMESVNPMGMVKSFAAGLLMSKVNSVAGDVIFHPKDSWNKGKKNLSEIAENTVWAGGKIAAAGKIVTGLAVANPITATIVAATALYNTGAIHAVGNKLGWNYSGAYHYNNSEDHPFHIKVEFNDPKDEKKSVSIDTKFNKDPYGSSKDEVTVSIKDTGFMNRAFTYFNPTTNSEQQYKTMLTNQLNRCDSDTKKAEMLIQTILNTFFKTKNTAKITITGYIYLKAAHMVDLGTGRWLAPVVCDLKKPDNLTWDQIGTLLYLQYVKNLIPTPVEFKNIADLDDPTTSKTLLKTVANPTVLCYLTTPHDKIKMNTRKIYSLFETVFPSSSAGNILVGKTRDDLIQQINKWLQKNSSTDIEDITAHLLLHYTYKPGKNPVPSSKSNSINIMFAPCTEGEDDNENEGISMGQQSDDEDFTSYATKYQQPAKPKQTLIEKIKERLGLIKKQKTPKSTPQKKVVMPTGPQKVTVKTEEPAQGFEDSGMKSNKEKSENPNERIEHSDEAFEDGK